MSSLTMETLNGFLSAGLGARWVKDSWGVMRRVAETTSRPDGRYRWVNVPGGGVDLVPPPSRAGRGALFDALTSVDYQAMARDWSAPPSLPRGESTESWFRRMESGNWVALGRKRGRPLQYGKWEQLRENYPNLLRDWLASGRYSPPPEILYPEAQWTSLAVKQRLQAMQHGGAQGVTPTTWEKVPDAATAAYLQAKEHARRGVPVYRPAGFDPSLDVEAVNERARQAQSVRSRRASATARRAGQDSTFAAITRLSNYYTGLTDPAQKVAWLEKYKPKLQGHPGYESELAQARTAASRARRATAASSYEGRMRRSGVRDGHTSRFTEGAVRRGWTEERARREWNRTPGDDEFARTQAAGARALNWLDRRKKVQSSGYGLRMRVPQGYIGPATPRQAAKIRATRTGQRLSRSWGATMARQATQGVQSGRDPVSSILKEVRPSLVIA